MSKILVLEDTAQHQRDARTFFRERTDVEAVYAWSLNEALSALDGTIDGILSDIFVPFDTGSAQVAPLGVCILLLAHERKIPCVLVTSGYHHGDLYEPVHQFLRTRNLPYMVDGKGTGSSVLESPTKDWLKAYQQLSAMLTQE